MFTRVSWIALAGTSFLVPVLVDITYVTLLVAFAFASRDVPVKAWLALAGRAPARAEIRVEVLVSRASAHAWTAVALAVGGAVDVSDAGGVLGAFERSGHAGALARVPEVLSQGVVDVAELDIEWEVGLKVVARSLAGTDATAFVVLPDHVGRAVARV